MTHVHQNGAWFSRRIAERTLRAIARQQKAFAEEHGQDTDSQLLDYVRECAQKLGATPHAREIIGGEYISQRMGGWNRVLEQLPDLPKPGPVPPREKCMIYQLEYRRQLAACREERHRDRLERAEYKAEKSEKRRAENKERLEDDLAWGEEHAHLTDRQLLEHVIRRAEELGYTPSRREVEGARYIAQHFGSWALVLELAGLPLPKDLKPARPSEVKRWQRQLADRRDEA